MLVLYVNDYWGAFLEMHAHRVWLRPISLLDWILRSVATEQRKSLSMKVNEPVGGSSKGTILRLVAAGIVTASLLEIGLVGAVQPSGGPELVATGAVRVAQGDFAEPKTAIGHWALVSVALRSKKKRLGNVADPSLVQLADGKIRLYFKNGNETQAGITGHDNLIHSAVSSNGGKSWKVESGARNIEWQSPIEVLPDTEGFRAFGWILSADGDELTTSTSIDGSSFPAPGDTVGFKISACKTPKGRATVLGDPSFAQRRNGAWVAVVQVTQTDKDDGSGQHLGYGCTYRSPSVTSWSAAKVSSFGAGSFGEGNQEVVTNPMVYRSGKVLERWTPAMDTVLFETSRNGRKWKGSRHYLPAADPERLDLADGTELLAFGNFDGRYGGVIVVTKKVSSDYTFQRQKLEDTLTIQVTGTGTPADVKIWNLCANKPAKKIATASVEIAQAVGGLEVTIRDSGEPKGLVLNCYYALVGASKVLG